MNPQDLLKKRIQDLSGWRGELVEKLAKIVEDAAPDATLEWKWDTAVWSQNGLICAVGAFKDNAGLNFFKGANLPDPDKIFNGGLEAKTSRSVRYYEGDKINEPALKDLIMQAIKFNTSGKK